MPARIGFDQLPDALQTRLRPRVERLGYLGEFFQVAAHQPQALAAFIDYTEALKSALPKRLTEVIALTAAAWTKNDYERVQHERLALSVGFTQEEVQELVAERSSLASFSRVEQLAVAMTREVCAGGGGGSVSFETLEDAVGEELAVGCLMTAVRYLAHATMANTWKLAPPVESPLGPVAPRQT